MGDHATVWTVSDGLVTRMDMYPTLAGALAAVG